jgi:tRNA A37 methylthiotransferase MiaB
MPGFHGENFGCRAARADGEAVSEQLRAAGHCAQQPAAADVVVVNTCSVTAEADQAARAFIRRAHRVNPAARIVVTGCYAQRWRQKKPMRTGKALWGKRWGRLRCILRQKWNERCGLKRLRKTFCLWSWRDGCQPTGRSR